MLMLASLSSSALVPDSNVPEFAVDMAGCDKISSGTVSDIPQLCPWYDELDHDTDVGSLLRQQ